MNWTFELRDQLSLHWDNQLRPSPDGLTDAEYFWEPVHGAWSVRPDANSRYQPEASWPPPSPSLVTTIAWRVCHIIGPVLYSRNASYFGGAPFDPQAFGWPASASEALALLDQRYATWKTGVESLDEAGLTRTAQERFGPCSMAARILHIHREVIHRGAEWRCCVTCSEPTFPASLSDVAERRRTQAGRAAIARWAGARQARERANERGDRCVAGACADASHRSATFAQCVGGKHRRRTLLVRTPRPRTQSPALIGLARRDIHHTRCGIRAEVS